MQMKELEKLVKYEMKLFEMSYETWRFSQMSICLCIHMADHNIVTVASGSGKCVTLGKCLALNFEIGKESI